MKAMALNSVQNNQSSITVEQVLTVIAKSISEYGKKEDLVLAVGIVCGLALLVGALVVNVATIVAGVAGLVLSLSPMIYRWCREDYNRDF